MIAGQNVGSNFAQFLFMEGSSICLKRFSFKSDYVSLWLPLFGFYRKINFRVSWNFFSSTISYWRQQIKFDSSYWWKFEFSFNIGVVRLELIRPVNHPNVIVMVRETIDSSVVLNQIYKGLNKANPIKY